MQISLKANFFKKFLSSISGNCTKFLTFQKKMIVIATLFRKLQAVKNLVKLLSKKNHFGTPFDSQYAKGSQTLVKLA